MTNYLNLEIPLNQQQISALERERQGGSVKLDFWINLHIDEFRRVQVPRR